MYCGFSSGTGWKTCVQAHRPEAAVWGAGLPAAVFVVCGCTELGDHFVQCVVKVRNELDEHRAVFDAVMAGQLAQATQLIADHYRRTAAIATDGDGPAARQ